MIRALLIAGLVAASGPAFALSCIPPDPARDFDRAASDENQWVVVHGKLTFDKRLLPNRDGPSNDAAPTTDIPAYFKGQSLTRDGFTNRFETPITLTARCFGPWCGGAVTNTDYLAFMQKDGDSYTMTVDPCGSNSYPKPSQEVLDRIQACMNGDCPVVDGPIRQPKKR